MERPVFQLPFPLPGPGRRFFVIVRTPDLPQVLKTMPRVKSFSNVVNILGDQTDLMYSFFRDGSGKDDARTVAVGKSTPTSLFYTVMIMFKG